MIVRWGTLRIIKKSMNNFKSFGFVVNKSLFFCKYWCKGCFISCWSQDHCFHSVRRGGQRWPQQTFKNPLDAALQVLAWLAQSLPIVALGSSHDARGQAETLPTVASLSSTIPSWPESFCSLWFTHQKPASHCQLSLIYFLSWLSKRLRTVGVVRGG